MIRGAIFDFDGTLFDTMFIWDSIAADYLRSISYEPRENLNEVLKSMSLHQAACYYRSEYGVTLSTEEIIEGVNNEISHYYRDVVQPKDGIVAFLQRLKDSGVKMCIATATDKNLIDTALERCDMSGFFCDSFTCSEVGHGKDEPDIYRTALSALGTEKASTVVFEDALHAVRTAKQDGFTVAGVYDKYEQQQAQVKALADIYLSGFTDFEVFWRFACGI